MKSPKILFWDVETSPILGLFWHLRSYPYDYENIVKDWCLLCVAWKFLGEKKVNSLHITKYGDDEKLVKKFREVLASADIVVYHNGDKFDLKAFNTRLIYHGLQPLPKLQTVDTLKELRKIARFSSNRLDYLGKTLFNTGKAHNEFTWWKEAVTAKKLDLTKMVKYNQKDVQLLERLYLRLLPYMKRHPHVGVIQGKDRYASCPKCGSDQYRLNGTKVSAAGIVRQECQCLNCYGYFSYPKPNPASQSRRKT